MFRKLIVVLLACFMSSANLQIAQPDATLGSDDALDRSKWKYMQDVPVAVAPAAGDSAERKWCDFILTPSVFEGAREDLGDLRLCDGAGVAIPYVLRERKPEKSSEEVASREFNRAVTPDQSTELTLDLGEDPTEHNALEVRMDGADYRRPAILEASDDGKQWSKILEKNLVSYAIGNNKLEDLRLAYPPSRYRYLRLRVKRDETVDEKPIEITETHVRRAIVLPGEYVTLPAKVGPREPKRVNGTFGSTWIIDLQAAKSPCEKLLVDIGTAEFGRDYTIEKGGLADSNEFFSWIAAGEWKRTAGDPRKPMEATFTEVRAARLRLSITDNDDMPLDIGSVQYVAPAREIVFEDKPTLKGPLRLFYGNPEAEAPHYDLERLLANVLTPPTRLTLSERQLNPVYIQPPLSLSERMPWAIYVVLGVSIAALAIILLSLGRKAIALHDAAVKPA